MEFITQQQKMMKRSLTDRNYQGPDFLALLRRT